MAAQRFGRLPASKKMGEMTASKVNVVDHLVISPEKRSMPLPCSEKL